MAKTSANSPHDTTRTSAALREPKQAPLRHDEFGQEILDPQPMQPPLGYKKGLSLSEQIRQQVRLAQLDLEDSDITETDEEADDFEVGDDYEPLSKHENDHIPSVKELKKRAAAINAEIRKRNNAKAIEEHEAKKKRMEGGSAAPEPKASETAPSKTISKDDIN